MHKLGVHRITRGKKLTLLSAFCALLLVFSTVFADDTEHPKLDQNFPNPFNSTTEINYYVPVSGHVLIKVYNMLGKEVQKLVDEDKPKGSSVLHFDGSNLPSGQYSYTMIYTSEGYEWKQTRKMYLVK